MTWLEVFLLLAINAAFVALLPVPDARWQWVRSLLFLVAFGIAFAGLAALVGVL